MAYQKYKIPADLLTVLSLEGLSFADAWCFKNSYHRYDFESDQGKFWIVIYPYKNDNQATCFVKGAEYFNRIERDEELIESLCYLNYAPAKAYNRGNRLDKFLQEI